MVVAITVYLLMTFVFVANKKQVVVCKNINVIIDDNDEFTFFEPNDIKSILLNSGEKIIDEQIDNIDTYKLKQVLSRQHAIKSIKIYTTIDKTLNVEIKQRRPILRVQCNNARFYIDDSGYVFPFSPKPSLHIPIVTGTMPKSIASNYSGAIKENEKFLNELYEFAVFLQEDEFWNSMIAQININNNKIELIPQIAAHVVILGSLENFKSRLDKLRKFYKYAMPTIGWEKYKTINIEYRNQIVCKK